MSDTYRKFGLFASGLLTVGAAVYYYYYGGNSPLVVEKEEK